MASRSSPLGFADRLSLGLGAVKLPQEPREMGHKTVPGEASHLFFRTVSPETKGMPQ